jgi:hypothetical protein
MSEPITADTFPNEDLLRAELHRMYRNGRAATAIVDAAIVAHRHSGGANHPLLDALLDVRSALRAE